MKIQIFVMLAVVLILGAGSVQADVQIFGNPDFVLKVQPFGMVPISLKYFEIGTGLGVTVFSFKDWLALNGLAINFGERKVYGAGVSIKTDSIPIALGGWNIVTVKVATWAGWTYTYQGDVDYGKITWGGFDCGMGIAF